MDNFYKIGVLLIGAIFTFLYFQNMNNNRYSFTGTGLILDTKTGILYKIELDRHSMPVWDSSKGAIIE